MNMDKIYDKTLYDNTEYEKNRIRRIEEQIKAKPTSKDLKDTVLVLKDFGIIISVSDIPDVDSVFKLEQWKAKLIKQRLDKVN